MWQNFIDYCNDGHQIIFFTVMVIFWAICYFKRVEDVIKGAEEIDEKI